LLITRQQQPVAGCACATNLLHLREIFIMISPRFLFSSSVFCLFYECGKWKMEIEEENCMMHHWMRLLLMDLLSQTFGSNCKSYSGL